MNISKHFTIKEVYKSYTADRLEIDNIPSPTQTANAVILANNVLEPIRVHFGRGFTPNSWFRCEELERVLTKTGFAKWAKRRNLSTDDDSTWDAYFIRKSHPNAKAVDIEIPGVDNDELFRWIRDDSGLQYDQLIREFARKGDPKSGWVHVSYSINDNRMQAFSIG